MGAAARTSRPGVRQHQGGASLASTTSRRCCGFGRWIEHAGYPPTASPHPARGCLGHLPATHQHRPSGSRLGGSATSPTSTHPVRTAGPHCRWPCLCGPCPHPSPRPSPSLAGDGGCRRPRSSSTRVPSSCAALGERRSAGLAFGGCIRSEWLAAV